MNVRGHVNKIVCGSLIAISFGVFVWLLSIFFMPSKIFIINDFTDIPSKTLMNDTAMVKPGAVASTHWVDNIRYINEQRFLGLYRYDPSTRKVPPQADVAGIPISNPLKFAHLKDHSLLVYNSYVKEMLVNDPNDQDKKAKILALLPNPLDRARVKTFYQQWDAQKLAAKTAVIPYEQRQFYHYNLYEMSASLLVWHFFHHHTTMFGPLSAYHLGQASADNPFFYGWLAGLTLDSAIHLTGDFTFQHYLEILYSFYPLYYFFWIAVIYLLSRNLRFTLLATLLMCGSIYLVGFEELRFQPGLNPLRHWLDLPVITCFYLFLTRKSVLRHGYLAAASLLSALAILNNSEFGLSLAAALLGTLIVYASCQREARKVGWFYAGLTLAFSVLALYFLPKTPYSLLKYFFLGVATPAANFALTYLIGAVSCLVYLFLLWDKRNSLSSKMLILFVCFYYQAMSLYYVIYAAPAHVRAMFPIAIIGVILIAKNVLTYIQKDVEMKNFWLALFIPSVVFYGLTLLCYVNVMIAFIEVKNHHQQYFWDFKRAQFHSDMDPTPFKNTLSLIDRYAQQPGIYLISKYDVILYWLSDHYSQLPYGTLAIGVPSRYEQAIVIDKINRADSCFLFVDADIASSHFGDVRQDATRLAAPIKPPKFRNYDIGSIKTYYALADLFNKVKDRYHLKERGDLIDVYEANRCVFHENSALTIHKEATRVK